MDSLVPANCSHLFNCATKKLSLSAVALALILSLAACGGGSGNSNQNITVSVSPATVTLFTNQTATFTAAVTGTSNMSVTWSVQEGASGGSITSAGVYTAPASTGTFHVIATSQANSAKSGSATATVNAAPQPNFTSTPGTSASEGQVYSYTVAATDPAGGEVTYALTSGPTDATLDGSVLSWTPSHAQSRVENNFTITATTTEGATATQAFSVTPTGNINGTNNVVGYSATGKMVEPETNISSVLAFIPDGKGSYTTITGTAGPGTFTIPDVPAGYFLLQVNAGNGNILLWTSTSDVDLSTAYAGRLNPTFPTSTPTLNINFTNPIGGYDCYLIVPNLGPWVYINEADFYTCNATWKYADYWTDALPDPAKGDQTYIYLYQGIDNLLNGMWGGNIFASSAGPLNLSIPDGGNVNFSGSTVVEPLNGTVRANLGVAQLTTLAKGVQPGFPEDTARPYFFIGVQPFTTDYYLGNWFGPVNRNTYLFQVAPLRLSPNSQTFDTDADLGDIKYSNPFPSSWATFAALQIEGKISYTADGSSSPTTVNGGLGTYSLTMPTSGSPIEPLVGPATSIKINGADFFQDQSNIGTQPVVSWSPPSSGTPDGYSLSVVQLKSVGTDSKVGNVYTIYTTQTSVTIPPGLLETGYAYFFQLQAFKGNSNIEMAPRYESFPWGWADAFSGTLHVNQ